MIVVLTTTPSIAEAESLARKIVESRLAACVQILPAMASVYIWNGSVQSDTEHLLLIKTLAEKYPELERFIVSNHSYEVPEIVALNADQVSKSYLGWMIENLAKEAK
ncbi:MAG: divalent-cation tolerance protein CutA [Acidobacteria bacterium]|nr:divalent-cation tolerance protein CutA [Acidobacteriota bacterium]MBK8148428.1 divalent-cation tolerance protein CutA [Acidobacteriota bacterium]MBK8813290.1 divalent-cation tolerance protein CutA [Acidobacteriota bacterium]